MQSDLYRLLSPQISYRAIACVRLLIAVVAFLVLMAGLFAGLVIAPADYQQGDAFRIMYVHVPAAVISMLAYGVMAIAAFVFLVWKVKVADMLVAVSAPIGAAFTLMTLLAGSVWGKPTWGTWWIWDARLTSELILLFIYFGLMAVRAAIAQPALGARVTAVLVLIGVINLPIIHYSVVWWHTLHQGATLLKFSSPSIAPAMLWPLLLMITGAVLLYVWLLCINLQSEILRREALTSWVKQLAMGADA